MICRHDGPELAAIVDWELTTIEDPLLDMGWLLSTRPSAGKASKENGDLFHKSTVNLFERALSWIL